jgi:hypothetical protein
LKQRSCHYTGAFEIGWSPGAAGWSSIPLLAALPLHRDAGRISDLDPDGAPTGSICAIDPLGDDALGTKPAGVSEDGGSILRQVVIEQDARLRITQQ